MEVSEVMYVPRLEKNLISLSATKEKVFKVYFKSGKLHVRLRGSDLNSRRVIGTREGSMYLFRGEPVQALTHDNNNLCELWNMRMDHLHYRALPLL